MSTGSKPPSVVIFPPTDTETCDRHLMAARTHFVQFGKVETRTRSKHIADDAADMCFTDSRLLSHRHACSTTGFNFEQATSPTIGETRKNFRHNHSSEVMPPRHPHLAARVAMLVSSRRSVYRRSVERSLLLLLLRRSSQTILSISL